MAFLFNAYCRVFQTALKYASYLLPWRTPEILQGEGCLTRLPAWVAQKKLTHALIVTDQGIANLGLHTPLVQNLHKNGIKSTVFGKTSPNPTIDNIEEGLVLFKQENCDCLIAFGGGSPIDCAKGVGARVARPRKPVQKMRGLFGVLHKLPPLIAVPTTAGTGSETTLAAVITNSKTHEKYPINDLFLIPCLAVLDPALTIALPSAMTAFTGMDTLTHAVEAYIGRSNTRKTRLYAREATALVFGNLYAAYTDGNNIIVRQNMQTAAFKGGAAFTRAYVGNVHAIAHTLGGFYNIPHGIANAVLLPLVLEQYGSTVHRPLAELSDLVEISGEGQNEAEKAAAFIRAIYKMNKDMEIPSTIEGILDADIPQMVEHAFQEANPLYPVPKIFTRQDFILIYKKLQGK